MQAEKISQILNILFVWTSKWTHSNATVVKTSIVMCFIQFINIHSIILFSVFVLHESTSWLWKENPLLCNALCKRQQSVLAIFEVHKILCSGSNTDDTRNTLWLYQFIRGSKRFLFLLFGAMTPFCVTFNDTWTARVARQPTSYIIFTGLTWWQAAEAKKWPT